MGSHCPGGGVGGDGADEGSGADGAGSSSCNLGTGVEWASVAAGSAGIVPGTGDCTHLLLLR